MKPFELMLPNVVKSFEEVFLRWNFVLVEPKIDGIRIQAHIEGKEINLFTRTGKDITLKFPHLCKSILESVEGNDIVLDGEMVAVNDGKIQPFETTMSMLKKKGIHKPSAIFFDLIDFNGNDAMSMPFIQRKDYLRYLLKANKYVSITPTGVLKDEAEAEKVYRDILKKGFEGIVLKNPEAPYTFGRTSNILKLKPLNFQDFKIINKTRHQSGGFTYEVSDGKQNLNIREYLNIAVGNWVEVGYEKTYENGKLKFPKIIRVRDDK